MRKQESDKSRKLKRHRNRIEPSTKKEENNEVQDKKIDVRRSLLGDLKDDSKEKMERQNNLQRRLDETNKGRISISTKPPDRNKGKKKVYTDKQQKIIEEEYEKDYVWIRREVEGYAPLYKLDIWNKIKTSLRLMDEKSGKTAKKEADKARIENMKLIKIESEIKRKVTEFTKDILENGVEMMEIEITISPDHIPSLKRVLSQEYFGMFKLNLVDINPNLKRYGINPPILLVVERRSDK